MPYKIVLHVIVLHKVNPNTCNTNRTYELLLLSYRGAERERLGKVGKLNPGHCSNDCSSPFLLLDEDECANSNGGCSQRCDNFPGNFRCSCAYGYTLQQDKKACQGKNCSFFKWIRSNFLSLLKKKRFGRVKDFFACVTRTLLFICKIIYQITGSHL